MFQSSLSKPHYVTALLKSSIREVPILQIGTGDQEDVCDQLLSVLNDSGPLGGAAIVLKDGLNKGKVTLVTR